MEPGYDLFLAGLMVTSVDHRVLFANSYLHDLVGRDSASLIASSALDFLTPASRIFFDSFLLPMLMTEKCFEEADLTIFGADGARLHVVASIRLADGPEPQFIWCITRAENRKKVYADLLQAREEVKEHARRMQDLAATDVLTGLPNRREFERLAMRDLRMVDRTAKSLVIALLDIDHFKSVNDRFGHAVGDAVLQKLAAVMRESMRGGEAVARFGGEEFVCSLPGADFSGGMAFSARIHAAARNVQIDGHALTVSIGLVLRPEQGTADLQTLIQQADTAMYQAKQGGRDRTIWYGDERLASAV